MFRHAEQYNTGSSQGMSVERDLPLDKDIQKLIDNQVRPVKQQAREEKEEELVHSSDDDEDEYDDASIDSGSEDESPIVLAEETVLTTGENVAELGDDILVGTEESAVKAGELVIDVSENVLVGTGNAIAKVGDGATSVSKSAVIAVEDLAAVPFVAAAKTGKAVVHSTGSWVCRHCNGVWTKGGCHCCEKKGGRLFRSEHFETHAVIRRLDDGSIVRDAGASETLVDKSGELPSKAQVSVTIVSEDHSVVANCHTGTNADGDAIIECTRVKREYIKPPDDDRVSVVDLDDTGKRERALRARIAARGGLDDSFNGDGDWDSGVTYYRAPSKSDAHALSDYVNAGGKKYFTSDGAVDENEIRAAKRIVERICDGREKSEDGQFTCGANEENWEAIKNHIDYIYTHALSMLRRKTKDETYDAIIDVVFQVAEDTLNYYSCKKKSSDARNKKNQSRDALVDLFDGTDTQRKVRMRVENLQSAFRHVIISQHACLKSYDTHQYAQSIAHAIYDLAFITPTLEPQSGCVASSSYSH